MAILVINCGSSSIKYKVFDMTVRKEPLIDGIAEKIGFNDSSILHKEKGIDVKRMVKPLKDHNQTLQEICRLLKETDNEITAIGHRVVHGGPDFSNPVLVDHTVKDAIRKNGRFAPLHNPVNLAGIEMCERLFPGVPNIAVFDTAAYHTIPAKSYLYGIPVELYYKHKIRRYGFQGISHNYVAREAAKILNKDFNTLNIITCHLGNGSSITAFKQGKAIDTSMGLTPLEGLIMATRCGDIDPSIVFYLMESTEMSSTEVNNMLNKNSGLKGLCEKSDMREIIAAAQNGDKQAKTAIEVFVYRIQKYIGAYIAALNGVDIIVFTAGIGENSPYIRERVLECFNWSGFRIDRNKNEQGKTIFSDENSTVCTMTIPTDEEYSIAIETCQLLAQKT